LPGLKEDLILLTITLNASTITEYLVPFNEFHLYMCAMHHSLTLPLDFFFLSQCWLLWVSTAHKQSDWLITWASQVSGNAFKVLSSEARSQIA